MKVAICGVWHVHAEHYFTIASREGEVVGVYDADAQRRREFCEKYNVKELATMEELLESEAEGIIVCSETSSHTDDMVRIANAGKDIFTEKVLALTVEDSLRIKKAVEENGVRFVISFPQKFFGGNLTVKRLAESGKLGRINFLRCRVGHNGSLADWLPASFYDRHDCGGGAMMDLGAHIMYLTEWILGKPEAYTSMFTVCENSPKNRDGVEDNAVTMMRFAGGCIAVVETSFVQMLVPETMLEVSGDKGYVRFDEFGVRICTNETNEQFVPVEKCADEPIPIERFMRGETVPECSIDKAVTLTEMMVGAYGNQVK